MLDEKMLAYLAMRNGPKIRRQALLDKKKRVLEPVCNKGESCHHCAFRNYKICEIHGFDMLIKETKESICDQFIRAGD